MRTLLAITFIAFAISACDISVDISVDNGIRGYSCDIAQNELVAAQFAECSKTDYYNTHCYSVAVQDHCTLMHEDKAIK